MQRVLWDFFGPNAEPTARHFHRHLGERLEREGWAAAALGVTSAGDGHCAAYCDLDDEMVEQVRAALKPARIEPL